jgi:hypothetical protein
MPSTGDAQGKSAQRARIKNRILDIALNGGPSGDFGKQTPGLDWYADNLEPRQFLDIADEIEYVGEVECLVASGSIQAGGGFTLQMQVLPAYVHQAVDLAQRSSQGVLVAVLFQAPWELFRPAEDDPRSVYWPQIDPDVTALADADHEWQTIDGDG